MMDKRFLTDEEIGFGQELDGVAQPAKPKILSDSDIGFEAPKPSSFESVKDSAIALGTGVTQGIGMLANVAGADNAVSRTMADSTQALSEYESPYRKAEKQERARKIKEAEESGSTLKEVGAYLGSFAEAPIDTTLNALGTSLPTLAAGFIPGAGQAAVGARIAQLGLGAAQGVGAVKGQIFDEVKKAWKEKGATEEDAAARAAQAQSYTGDNAGSVALGGALGAVAGSYGAEAAVRRMAGKEVAERAAQTSVLKGAGMGALKEAPMEGLQGGQERLASNLALQNEGFDQGTWTGVLGSSALEATAAAPMGAGFGAMEARGQQRLAQLEQQRRAEIEQQLQAIPEHQQPAARAQLNAELNAQLQAEARAAGLMDEEQGQTDGPPGSPSDYRATPAWAKPPEDAAPDYASADDEIFQSTGMPQRVDPVREAVRQAADAGGALSAAAGVAMDSGAAPTFMPPPLAEQPQEPQPDPIVLQNRDRNSAASISQMQEIAANPDYLRVGPSRDMTSGAPIVFGDLPPTAVLGRQELVVDGNGQRVGTQYAVVDAGDLIASNHADGSTVAEYATGVRGKLRSVAGNGRTAGLQAAYDRGTAQGYRQELLADAASIGVDAQALAGMQRPVLVRVMGQGDVTADIGDRTNITGTQKLSPVEQAANDARRFDIANLAFDEGGNPTAKSIAGFVSSMPVSEQGDMMNPDGSPTRQAVDRLMAATFKQAYDSDELVQLYAQAADPDARAVLSAAADASGVMAALSGTDFDVRQAVADAVKMAVNASRQGLKLSDVLQNADFDMNPEAYPVATFLAQNIRSPKAMAEGLRRWGQLALQQARVAEENKYQGNLLGDPTPTLSRQEILARIGDAYNPTEQAVAGRAQPQAELASMEPAPPAAMPVPGNFSGTPAATIGTRMDAVAGPGFGPTSLKDALAQIRARKQTKQPTEAKTNAPTLINDGAQAAPTTSAQNQAQAPAAPQQTPTWATMPPEERQQAAQAAGLNPVQTAEALKAGSIEEMPAAVATKLAPVLSSAAGSEAQAQTAVQGIAFTRAKVVDSKDKTVDGFTAEFDNGQGGKGYIELQEQDGRIFPTMVDNGIFGGEKSSGGAVTKAYEAAIDLAQNNGKEFTSDDSVTVNAARIYESLKRRGYQVFKNPAARLASPPEVVTERWMTDDGSPVYAVGGKTQGKWVSALAAAQDSQQNQPPAQAQQAQAATESVAEAIPIFERYDDAMAWMKDRAKSQGLSVIAYRATDEFKNALSPQLQALYAASKSKWDADTAEAGKAMQDAMAKAGIRPGDTVQWNQPGAFLTTQKLSGVVKLDRLGVPHVHMSSEVAVAKAGGKIGYTKKLRWQPYMQKPAESASQAVTPVDDASRRADTAATDSRPAQEALSAQTPAEAAAQQDAQEQAAKAEAAAKRAADAAAKAEEERKRIAQASVAAADSFELGQDPMDSLTGQGSLLDAPAQQNQPPAQAQQAQAATETVATTAQSEDAPLPPKLSSQLQEAHKAIGRGVTRRQAQSMRDRIANEIETGTTNNGGVQGKLRPAMITQRKAQLARLDQDLALFDSVAPRTDEKAKQIEPLDDADISKTWEKMTVEARLAAIVASDPRMSTQRGTPTKEAKGLAELPLSAFAESARARLQPYIDLNAGQKQTQTESKAPADDLNAMFDELMAETAPQAPAPKAQPKAGANTARKPRTAAQAAGSAVKNTAAALNNAIDGLGALFGAKSGGRMSSGLSFDEGTYAQAKPLFIQAVSNLKEASADIREAMRAVINMVTAKFGRDVTENMKPYIVRFVSDVRDGTISQEELNAPSTNANLERDSNEPATEPAVGSAVPGDARGVSGNAGRTGGQAAGAAGRGQPGDSGLPTGGTAADGERSDFSVSGRDAAADAARIATGSDFSERGSDIGVDGVSVDPVPAKAVDAVASKPIDRLAKAAQQREAEKVPVKPGDLENIKATLPYLLEGQQEDVLKTEARFSKPDGYGMLFTNGTGTGKTFTGLGVVKRMARQGKNNVLIVVPDDKIAADWIDSGVPLGLNISKLQNTKSAGSGIVITTYANLGDNDALARRQWDMVVADEAHTLMQSADGAVTGYLANLRAITHHPDGAYQRHTMLNRKDIDALAKLSEQIQANIKILNNNDTMDAMMVSVRAENERLQKEADALTAKLREAQEAVQAEVKGMQGAKRARLLALSATPFAYEFTVDWANGYLFDYNEGQASDKTEFRGYNQGSNKDRFFMANFGYTMRYNKLTKPDPTKVDTGLLQRNFNVMLRKSGALSSRMLDVPADYDRRFVLVDSGIGNQIDDALNWISEQRRGAEQGNMGYATLADLINEKFDYLSRRYLLEAIKATEVVPIVRQHMAMGRKVVVFHDYKKGGGFNPFNIKVPGKATEGTSAENAQALESLRNAVIEFRAKFKELVEAPLGELDSPIEVFKREFADVLLVNGDEKKAALLERYKRFQDDASGPQVMLVQSAKNKGWSGHDTTGKHQRVLINLGQPTAPTMAIQQEGRIYRTGQVTDAIMRYLNTGTSWERMTFAQTIAGRASAAENLGMGEQARALKDSFINAFEESDTYAPGHEGEGKGGKERDKMDSATITAFDRAKTYYWGSQKKTSKTKAQEGKDYFATPEPLGLKMAEWLDLRGSESALEPSAGHGAIARWLPETASRTAIEPSNTLRARLALAMDASKDRLIDGTFEAHAIVNKYDGIVMNPPFGVGGKTAIEHLDKASKHLRDGGRIVALIPTGPAADKRFDQWMNGESERPTKPLYTHPEHGPIYKGDTVETRASWAPVGIVKSYSSEYGVAVQSPKNPSDVTSVSAMAITSVKPTGQRTETYRASEGIYQVAEIKLPQVTFERAGTAVATRIVILEKQTDAARAPNARAPVDLTDITDINELFNRIEDMKVQPRAMTAAQEQADKEAKASEAKASKADATPATQPKAPNAANPAAVGTVDRGGAKVITHTTGAGKTIHGIVKTDWTLAQARAVDPYTFKKNGGFFIREAYLKPEGDTADISRSFAGQQAATADTMALATAQQRLEAGEDAETVRKETGWHKGVDGKWRFEISDADARMKDRAQWTAKIDGINAKLDAALQAKWQAEEQRNDFLRARGESPSRISSETKKTPEFKALAKALKNAEAAAEKAQDAAFLVRQGDSLITVGDVLSHPALFAAYPGIANVRVDINDSLPAGNASYAYELRAIELSGKSDAQQLLSTLLHEIQHGIQHIEGFAMGGPGGVRMWLGDMRPIAEAEYRKLVTELNTPMTVQEYAQQAWQSDTVTPEIQRDYTENFLPAHAKSLKTKGLDKDAQITAGWRAYKKLAGEVEARNTQARQNLTDAQRRATTPSQTADVADSDVIVMFNGKVADSAPAPANAAPDAVPQPPQPLRTPAATIRAAITKAYGKLLGQLESKGLVTLAQTEAQAIEAAAQARADKTGGDVAQIKRSLTAAMQGDTDLDVKRSAALSGITFSEDVVASYAGQTNHTLTAKSKNGVAGVLEYVVYEGVPSISMVSVSEKNRRQGIGRALVQELQSKFPDIEIEWGMLTEDGAALRNSLQFEERPNIDVQRKQNQLEIAVAERSQLEAEANKRRDSDEYSAWIQTVSERWNELHDEIDELESDLATSGPAVRRIVVASETQQSPASIDIKRSTNGAVQGFFDPQTGQSFLIADNLTAEAAPGVLMHEVGIHMAADGSMKALFNRAAMMLKLQKGNPFMKAVQARMDAAGETSGEEAAAYIAEAYENDRANAPASVQRWLTDLLAAVKAWMFKKGIMGADRLTVADIAAAARANARSMARDGGATGGQGFGPAFRMAENTANYASTAPARPGSAQDKAVMQAIADGKNARDVLRLVASGSKDQFLRQVAKMLLKAGITPNIEFGHIGKDKKGNPIHGQYRGKSDTIAIAGSAEYAAERIFMHEAMHAATMRALKKGGLARVQLQKLMAHVQKQKGAAGFYGMQNVDEFVAEVFTNPDFQAALRKMSAPAGNSLKSAWHSFVRILRSILGLSNDSSSALAQALELGVEAVRQDMVLRRQGARASGRANAGTDAIDQTQTEAFKRWFAGSRVVNADGKPLVVYHGTKGDFSTPRMNAAGLFFVTPDKTSVAEFTDGRAGAQTMVMYASIKKPFDASNKEAIEAVVAEGKKKGWIKNDVATLSYDSGSIPISLSLLRAGDYIAIESREVVNAIKALGHDGIKITERGMVNFAVFGPEQVKSAIGNNGNFDPEDQDIRNFGMDDIRGAFNERKTVIAGQTSRAYTPEQQAAMRNVGLMVEQPSLKERAQALWQDAGKKLAQGVVDQFAPVKEISKDAYALLRLSKGASGAFETLLKGGKLKLSGGVYDFDEANKGGVVDALLTPLNGEHHDFLRWVAANRAERLMGEDRERLFTPDDIAALKTLADGQLSFDFTLKNGPRKGETTRSRAEAYKDSLTTFNAFNKNVLDMAEQSGLIDPESRATWESEFYVPFYRVADEESGGVRGMNIKGSVVRQQAFKHLKGGKQALNNDLLDNTLMNWAHLLDASAKNRAAKATLEAAQQVGAAIEAPKGTLDSIASSIGKKNGIVWFMDGGQKRHFMVDDPYLMTAISSLEYAGMNSPIMTAMGAFKHALTIGVTASPFFKIRNLIRDSVQVVGTSSIGTNPLKNVADGWKLTDPKNDAYFRLLAGGGTIHFGAMLEGSEAKRVQALVESGVQDSTILNTDHKIKQFYRKYIEPGITAYNELGNRGEAVNRAALYDQLRKQGVGHAEASLQARDLMDFSMQGSFTSIRFLSQVVPFLNARLQGMYKLGRAANENPKRMAYVTGAVAMASLALLAAYGDDDDWKRREDWDRNNFWWFKVGGIAFRIPKPFELGAIGTLAERSAEYLMDDEMTGKRFRGQVLKLLGDNLSMNPIPQAVKPLLDVYANKDSFRNAPIESMGMERMKSEYRFNDRTSMVARGMSTAANSVTGLVGAEALSPVQIDHLLRGYFGWLGTFAVGTADMIARPVTNQPTQATQDIWKKVTGGIASQLEDAPSRYVSSVYDQAKELEQAYGTWRALQKSGKPEEAAAFFADNREEIARYRSVTQVKSAESKLNERIRQIERNEAMDGDQKREEIRRIRAMKEALAKQLAPA